MGMAFLSGFLRSAPQRLRVRNHPGSGPRSTSRSRRYRLAIIAGLNIVAWSLVAGIAFLLAQMLD